MLCLPCLYYGRYGPTIDVFEQDKVVLSISNHGNDDQATHCQWLAIQRP